MLSQQDLSSFLIWKINGSRSRWQSSLARIALKTSTTEIIVSFLSIPTKLVARMRGQSAIEIICLRQYNYSFIGSPSRGDLIVDAGWFKCVVLINSSMI